MSPVGGQAAQPLEVHACPGRPPIWGRGRGPGLLALGRRKPQHHAAWADSSHAGEHVEVERPLQQLCPIHSRRPLLHPLLPGRCLTPRARLLCLGERERRGRDLDDVQAAELVEQLGAAQVVQKRLAVVAVADDAVHRVWLRIAQPSVYLSATTLELDVSRHGSRPYH